MKTTANAVLAALALSASLARAEIPPPRDEVSKAYDAAIVDLHHGKDRQSIADALRPIVEKHPGSPYARLLAGSLVADLTVSAARPQPAPDAPPEARLADAGMAAYHGTPPNATVTKASSDPVVELMEAGRQVIPRLIPLLSNRSPTRGAASQFEEWHTPQPRVCDVALGIIEHHSKALFFHDTTFGHRFHQLADADREQLIKRVETWWAKMKDQSIAAGVRAQLPFARSYPEKVEMARTLARLGKGQNTDDREFALNVLRKMVQENRGNHVGSYAADALVEFGDTSAVDVFYSTWKPSLNHSGQIYDSHVAFYLCKHGRRREWELLYALSAKELVEDKIPPDGPVWPCTINSGVAGTNPYAIPVLGLVLSQMENPGSHQENRSSSSFSYATKACEMLQKQVSQDFGYRPDGMSAEQLAAIEKAKTWWEAEGKSKYTFDWIEQNMSPAKK